MQTFEIKGTVVAIGEEVKFDSGFRKRDLIVDTSDNPEYPSPVPFTFKKDRCALIGPVKAGDKVTVKFLVGGRRWDGPNGTKFFVDLTGWSVDVNVQAAQTSETSAEPLTEASSADVIKVWAIKHGCDLNAATADWNTATSELTKCWKTIFPTKRRNQLTPQDLAALVNAITGASAQAAEEPADEEFPF